MRVFLVHVLTVATEVASKVGLRKIVVVAGKTKGIRTFPGQSSKEQNLVAQERTKRSLELDHLL